MEEKENEMLKDEETKKNESTENKGKSLNIWVTVIVCVVAVLISGLFLLNMA